MGFLSRFSPQFLLSDPILSIRCHEIVPLHAACETCAEFQKILRWTQQQNEFDKSVSLYENIRLFATKHKIHRIRRGWSYAKNV